MQDTKSSLSPQLKSSLEFCSIHALGVLKFLEIHTYPIEIVNRNIIIPAGCYVVHLKDMSEKTKLSVMQIRTRLKELEVLNLITKLGKVGQQVNTVHTKITRFVTRSQHVIYRINTITCNTSNEEKKHGSYMLYISKYGIETKYFLERFKSMYDQRMRAENLPDRYDLSPKVNEKMAFDIINRIKQHIPGNFHLSWVDVIIKTYFELNDDYLLKNKFAMRLMSIRLSNLIEITKTNEQAMNYVTRRSTEGRTVSNETKDEKSSDFETFGLN